MARAVRYDLIINDAKWTSGLRSAARSSDRFTEHTKRASGSLKGLFAAFSVGVVVTGLKSTVDAASDLNETVSKTKVVFGPAAQSVENFSKRASTSIGLSRQEAMEAAATFGNLFVSMKIGAPRAAEMSTKMVQLAGDLASFNNASPTETLEALRSGLVGETEPLRKFGINLNDADLRQKALAMGLTNSTKNVLPPAIKAQAAYALILEQSKTAQGDFARTSGGLANQQRILAAKIKDLKASIGSALLPAVLAGVSAFNAFLGVVDRNKTAFTILLGVLGSAAAIIGTLLVVEKIHRAVSDSIKVATAGWATAQKGLNLVLGLTKGQAAAATVATEAQAAATTAAGTAAQGAAAKMGAAGLLGKVGGLGGALVALSPLLVTVGVGLEFWREKTDSATIAADKLTAATDKIIDSAIKNGTVNQAIAQSDASVARAKKDQGVQTAYAAQQAAAQRLEMEKALPGIQSTTEATARNTEELKKKTAELKAAVAEEKQNRDSMAQTIESYDGLISKSKTTASEVIKDIRNQTANFKTYSSDVHRLIKAGVNPAAIQELSQKGPQYVHALATGSNAQLKTYKQYWADRQREIKGGFARSIAEQYQNLVDKIRKMQRQINSLKGKTITITARTDVQISKSVRQYLAASNVPGFHAKGTLIPGYGGGDVYPAMLEPGEAVVPKEKARLPDFRAWAKHMGIPGFQFGGLVGRYYNPTVSETRRIGISEGKVAAAVLSQLMALPGGGGGAGAALARKVAQWTATVFGRAVESGAWFRRLMFESGGNPRAINRTDSNWFAGHPSVGIAQVIRGTFQANAGRYRGVGPFAYGVSMDPYANSYAGGHYAIGRYGSLAAVDPRIRPIGYDGGGGLRPGVSVVANNTGRTEPVGIDYDRLGRAVAKALREEPPQVWLDNRRVDRQQATAQALNARRR